MSQPHPENGEQTEKPDPETVESSPAVTTAEGAPARKRSRRPLWIGAGSTFALLVIAYVLLAWWTTTTTPGDTTVGGVDVSGQNAQQLRQTLATEVAERAAQPVTVKTGDAGAEFDPADAGLALDVDATTHKLVGFTLNPATVFGRLGGGDAVTPVVTADADRLEVALAELGAQIHTKPVEGALAFEGGTLQRTEPMAGTSLDIPAAALAFQDRWPAEQNVQIPTRQVAPVVDKADLDKAVEDFGRPATSGPVTFDVGGTPVELAPAAFAPALSTVTADGALEGRVDGAKLVEAITGPDTGVGAEPVNARFEMKDGVPTVVPGKNGVTIDPTVASDAFTSAIDAEDRAAAIETTVAEPADTTEELQNAGVKEPISEFDTRLTGSRGRVQNIRIASETITMTYLEPGETFSMNDTLGPRTRDKGYSSAPVIMNGIMETGVGGGVSQVATTLFNGAFFAGLEDVDHKAHSLYISRYPEGREATVNYPDVDLKFRNDTGHGVLIEMYLADGRVHTRFWGTKQYEVTAEKSGRYAYRSPRTITKTGPSCNPGGGSTGFSVDITRIFSQNGTEAKRDGFTTTYIAGPKVVCADQQTD